MWCDSVFFFQAEDGIRDLVRSRGLGDVYKRQLELFYESINKAKERKEEVTNELLSVEKEALNLLLSLIHI